MQQHIKKRLEAITAKRCIGTSIKAVIRIIIDVGNTNPPLTKLYNGNNEWQIKLCETEERFMDRAVAECKAIKLTTSCVQLIADSACPKIEFLIGCRGN